MSARRMWLFMLTAIVCAMPVLADGEQKAVEDLEAKIKALEARISESDTRAADAMKKSREWGKKADDFKTLGRQKNHEFNLQRDRAVREQRRFDRNVRTIEHSKRRIGELETEIAESRRSVKAIEDIRRDTVNEEQVEKLRRASAAQQEIKEKIAILRKILATDEPELQKLVVENRQENVLVEKQIANMAMVDAFELAKQLENEITESFKDIKATQTAIERKMSFASAQKITDVVKAVRIEADRKAIEDNPRTKEALDRQKVAQSEVVRETDSIVETVVAMMTEAMEIVKPDDGKSVKVDGAHVKTIPWMEKSDFEKRDTDEARQKRLEAMNELAEYALAIQKAAAEDESERAKDLTKVAEDPAEIKKNMDVADMMAKDPAENQGSLKGASAPPPLDRKMPGLVAGNVLRLAPAGDTVLPAKWMYVNSWYVIGPFPNPNRVNLRRKFPPESVIDLDATYIGKDGRTVRWEFMQCLNRDPKESWRSDARAEMVPYTAEDYGIWYAYAEVFVDEPCERWIAVGSDDRSDIWINDVPVWGSSNKLKSWRIDEGYRRIRLNRGRNRILARVENGWHSLGWSVCISVDDER